MPNQQSVTTVSQSERPWLGFLLVYQRVYTSVLGFSDQIFLLFGRRPFLRIRDLRCHGLSLEPDPKRATPMAGYFFLVNIWLI